MRLPNLEVEEIVERHAGPPWRRSRKGNLYRRLLGGAVVTVFRLGDGFAYCIKEKAADARFSKPEWETETEAAIAAMEEFTRPKVAKGDAK